MKFLVENGPHMKSDDNSSKIMLRVILALIPIICYALYKNSYLVYINSNVTILEALHPLFMILIAVITSILSEYLFIRFIEKKKCDDLKCNMRIESALLPGLFLSLVIPINTPLWLVALGAFIATVLGKMIFGGLGHNVFNPALIGALFITYMYGSLIASHGGYINAYELDTIGSATPLSNLSGINYIGTYKNIVGNFGGLFAFFFGSIPGTLGEVNKFLILLAFLYLAFSKVIKWRISLSYVFTVFLMTMFISINNDMGMWYPAFQVLSGGLLFGAVFMATDPVTSPISKTSQVFYGISLGILTVLLRFLTGYPEAVLTSILAMNMLVALYDKFGISIKFNFKKIIVPIIIFGLLLTLTTYYVTSYVKNINTKKDDNIKIIEVKKDGNNYTYTVTSKGWGIIKSDVVLENGKVTKINITDSSAETQWSEIEKNNYIDKLIDNQKDIENVDTISGTTRTSLALKNMIIRVIEEYEAEHEK